METHAQLSQLVDLLHLAGERDILPRRGAARSQLKQDGTLVTDADFAVHQRLLAALPRICPVPVLSEELSSTDLAALRSKPSFWCIDPIDGTHNFARGLPHFGISAALVQDGRTELSCVFAPVSGETFYALRGAGAWLDGVRLEQGAEPPGARVGCVNTKRLPASLHQALVQAPPYGHFRYYGACALELCDLAAGRLDLYLSGNARIWDYAAAALIVTEAGGRLSPATLPDPGAHPLLVAAATPAGFAEWTAWIAAHCPGCAIA